MGPAFGVAGGLAIGRGGEPVELFDGAAGQTELVVTLESQSGGLFDAEMRGSEEDHTTAKCQRPVRGCRDEAALSCSKELPAPPGKKTGSQPSPPAIGAGMGVFFNVSVEMDGSPSDCEREQGPLAGAVFGSDLDLRGAYPAASEATLRLAAARYQEPSSCSGVALWG